MKCVKKMGVSAFLIFLVGITYAQPVLIPRLGLTLSTSNASEVEDLNKKMAVGFTAGFGFEFNINSSFSIQPELNFVQKGFGFNGSVQDQTISFSVENNTHINYLEIPVLAKYYVTGESKTFYLMAGPSIGIGLGGKSKTSVNTGFLGQSLNVTVTGDVKFGNPPDSFDPFEDTEVYFDNRIDFGLQGGVGVTLFKKVVVEARYNLGLSDLIDSETSKNRVVNFSVGLPLNAFAKK